VDIIPITVNREQSCRLLTRLSFLSGLTLSSVIRITDYSVVASSDKVSTSPQLPPVKMEYVFMHKTSLCVHKLHNSGRNTNGHCTASATVVLGFSEFSVFGAAVTHVINVSWVSILLRSNLTRPHLTLKKVAPLFAAVSAGCWYSAEIKLHRSNVSKAE
jgi:hypothetical protein